MSRVVSLMCLQLSRGIGYDATILHQHTPQTTPRDITVHCKVLVSSWYDQYWCTRQSLFELLKCFLTLLRLFIPSSLPGQVRKRGGNFWEVLNKLVIVPRQTQETSYLHRVSRSGAGCHSLDLLGSTDTSSLDTTCPRNAAFLNQNSHVDNLAYNSFFLKTSRAVRRWWVCSSGVLK